MDIKYELTNETIYSCGHTLRRIKALRDFGDVKKGDLGGYVESDDNLSHDGNCWVYDNAMVFERGLVFGRAIAAERAQIYGYSFIWEDAHVYGDSKIYGNARLFDIACVYGDACVCGQVQVSNAKICGDCVICGDLNVFCDPRISEKIYIDHGIWDRRITTNYNYYLVSTTMQKILLGYKI